MTHYIIDPVDFEQTRQGLKDFLEYAEALVLEPKEIALLRDVQRYLDILSTNNWSVDDGL